MTAPLAAAIFHTWQALVLILLCCGALIISLYCLIFMVPVKRFWERIESLGGGMKGIKSHIDGVADAFGRRVEGIERTTQELVEENRAALRKSVRAASNELHKKVREVSGSARQATEGLKRLERELASLEAGAEQHSQQHSQLGRRIESASERLEQLQSDFDSLEVELRESVRQLVAESYQQLEATVLSALEAIQNQMLRGLGGPHRVIGATGKRNDDAFRSGRGGPVSDARGEGGPKIIPAGSLFTTAEKQSTEEDKEGKGAEQPAEGAEEDREGEEGKKRG